ncbi:uncharacterized protein LOC130052063 isoform X2 [Ostrea edulis]|uniref:uncharacterized protein LOC130052063 isoform X2 n=1 Tax=Ostrea edulis TaxID=37623 RepID=UPI0024AF55A8|nr:uncharacterized protein LOC130052063 isoform X2 [Ostrea edulis]
MAEFEEPKKCADWTREEEEVLIREVWKRKEILFGKMKGDGTVKIGEVRNRGRREVADVLNARSSLRKREAQDAEEKHYNIKQQREEKLNQIKKPKTDGGRRSVMSASKETLLDNMEGRPRMEGIACGINTEDQPCTSSARAAQEDTNTLGASHNGHQLAELKQTNLSCHKQHLRLEIEKLQYERELCKMKQDILLLKHKILECKIRAKNPRFVKTQEGLRVPTEILPEV